MSNRFHNKWHRRNHHTYGNASNPDAGHDPIASQEQPFLGEFVLQGSLSATAPLSAYAAFLYSDHTALCAFAGTRGMLVHSEGYLGAEIWSTLSTGISSYAPNVSIEAASPMRALSAYGSYLGMDVFSDVRAISAFGTVVGVESFSPRRALSAYGGQVGVEAASPLRALSAYGSYLGLDIFSDVKAISAFGTVVGIEAFSPRRALSAYAGQVAGEFYSPTVGVSSLGHFVAGEFFSYRRGVSSYGNDVGVESFSPYCGVSAWGGYTGGEFYSNSRALSAYGQMVSGEFYSPRRALSAYGGRVGLDVASPFWAVSAYGGLMAVGVYSDNVALSGYGALTGLKIEGGTVGAMIHSPYISLSTGGGGINILNSRTGIYKTPRDYYGGLQNGQVVLDVGGDVWIDGSTTIRGDLSALGTISYLDTNVTITSSFLVNNKGTDAAATIIQTGSRPILQCFDQDIDSSHSKASFIVDGATNGWVGIGVNTPTAPFNIVKNSSSNELGDINNPHLRIYDGSNNKIAIGTYGNNYLNANPGGSTNPYIGTENNSPFDIYTNSKQRVSISQDGNIGINAIPSTSKLSILGDSNSPTALSAFSINVGTQIFANNVAVSAYGRNLAGSFYSPTVAISAFGGDVAGSFYSPTLAISAFGNGGGAVIGGPTDINFTGMGRYRTRIGNVGGVLSMLGAPININVDSATSTNTNIGTGNTIGDVAIGNANTFVDVSITGGGGVTIDSTSTKTISIGSTAGVLTQIGNSTGATVLNSNDITAPNQVANTNNSLMTRSLADARYSSGENFVSLSVANTSVPAGLAYKILSVPLLANVVYEITSSLIMSPSATNSISSNLSCFTNIVPTSASVSLYNVQDILVTSSDLSNSDSKQFTWIHEFHTTHPATISPSTSGFFYKKGIIKISQNGELILMAGSTSTWNSIVHAGTFLSVRKIG